jgi:hypothetical protein
MTHPLTTLPQFDSILVQSHKYFWLKIFGIFCVNFQMNSQINLHRTNKFWVKKLIPRFFFTANVTILMTFKREVLPLLTNCWRSFEPKAINTRKQISASSLYRLIINQIHRSTLPHRTSELFKNRQRWWTAVKSQKLLSSTGNRCLLICFLLAALMMSRLCLLAGNVEIFELNIGIAISITETDERPSLGGAIST